MKKNKLLSLALALALTLGLAAPALAVEEKVPQEFSPWAVEAVADSYALGLVDNDYASYIQDVVTMEQMEVITGVVADKLALLGLEVSKAPAKELVIDTSRKGVMNALYIEAAAYVLPGIEISNPAGYLSALGVVKGDEKGDMMEERPCTYQEAMVMARRLILALYDANDAGSKGLLWKAVKGGNTLYLLGTIHLDRSNVYPFHKSLRSAIASAREVIFEVDLNNAEDLTQFVAMQTYTDGTTLKDHISPELYARTVAVFTQFGIPEAAIAVYKPWALMLTLQNLLAVDDGTGSNLMPVDMYINASAVNASKEIGAVETMVFQAGIFEHLSVEYQTQSLEALLAMAQAKPTEGTPTEAEQKEAQEALAKQTKMFDDMMAAWKTRNPEAMATILNKASVLESGDELNARLFTDRDPNMIKAAAAYLEREGENTFFMAVGAGHMLDPGGIVGGLKALGYTVELVK